MLDEQKNVQQILVFSSKFSCPNCGYSLDELEPRLFSFNNPAGACRDCDGLGIRQFFDPERIVHHPEMTLSGGAIPGWDRRNGYYHAQLTCLANHYGFDIDAPFHTLSKKHQNIIFYGNDELINFVYIRPGRKFEKTAHL